MKLFLDSALIKEVRICADWGWVSGVTTNPTLLAKSNFPPEESLRKLKALIKGPIFYQLTEKSVELMKEEAKQAYKILGKQLVLKIPATKLGFKVTALLSKKYVCAVTSIFTPSQGLVAHAAGARYALYYHNRAKRLMGKGEILAAELVRALKQTSTSVIAASLKSPEEIIEARDAGVPIMSASFKVLQQMMRNEFSEKAVDDFAKSGVGLLN
ncbi:MAG: hypothetical protein J7L66_04755 [Anaerolineaceae bacterium]|nr:hypothetical protein [Anaerolineaceae bacterium]